VASIFIIAIRDHRHCHHQQYCHHHDYLTFIRRAAFAWKSAGVLRRMQAPLPVRVLQVTLHEAAHDM
jgi:hypothetical protein